MLWKYPCKLQAVVNPASCWFPLQWSFYIMCVASSVLYFTTQFLGPNKTAITIIQHHELVLISMSRRHLQLFCFLPFVFSWRRVLIWLRPWNWLFWMVWGCHLQILCTNGSVQNWLVKITVAVSNPGTNAWINIIDWKSLTCLNLSYGYKSIRTDHALGLMID